MQTVSFFMPIVYGKEAATCSQKLLEKVDSYFFLGGKVAHVISGRSNERPIKVKLEQEKAVWWKVALLVLSYFTLVIPAIMLLAKGVLRCGKSFQVYAAQPATPMTQIAKKIFVKQEAPKWLFEGTPFPQKGIVLNFADRMTDGKWEIVPVQKPYLENLAAESKESYVRYAGSSYEALSLLAQKEDVLDDFLQYRCSDSPIQAIFSHPHNHNMNAVEFLRYISTPGTNGAIPLHKFSIESLLQTIELAKKHRYTLDLHRVDPTTNETLFSKWASKYLPLTKALLELDPTAIKQSEGRERSFFVEAALTGRKEIAEILLEAMKNQGVELTTQDQWILRALENDYQSLIVTEEEQGRMALHGDDQSTTNFRSLPETVKRRVYQVANIFMQKEFIQELRKYGMSHLEFTSEGPAILSYNMDAIEVEDTMKNFLTRLREVGRLLTPEEFTDQERSKYIPKGKALGRILGANYLERMTRTMKIDCVKVPAKIAVIKPDATDKPSIEIAVSVQRMELHSEDLEVYEEKIEAIDRKATRKEMLHLLDLIEAASFNNCLGDNFLMGRNQMGEEGIFCIDTAYANFGELPDFLTSRSLARLVDERELSWLDLEISHRERAFFQKREALETTIKSKKEMQRPAILECGFVHRRDKPFQFPIADLVEQKPDKTAIA